MATIGRLGVVITGDNTKFKAALKDSAAAARDSQRELRGIKIDIMSSLTRQVTQLVGAYTALKAVQWGVDMVFQGEQAQVVMSHMIGDAKQAAQFIGEIKDVVTSGKGGAFGFMDLTKAAQQMLVYNFTLNDTKQILKLVGDAAASFPMDPAIVIERVVRALGQMKSKGQVRADEIKQLAELGIPVWENLAKIMEKPLPDVMQAVTDRQVGADVGIRAVLTSMKERFSGVMEEVGQTWYGKWAKMKNVAQLAIMDVFTALGNQVNIGNTMDQITDKIRIMGEDAKSTAATIIEAFRPIALVFTGLYGMISAVGEVIRATAQIVGLDKLSTKTLTLKDTFVDVKSAAIDASLAIMTAFAQVADFLRPVFEGIYAVFARIAVGIVRVIDGAIVAGNKLGIISDETREWSARAVSDATARAEGATQWFNTPKESLVVGVGALRAKINENLAKDAEDAAERAARKPKKTIFDKDVDINKLDVVNQHMDFTKQDASLPMWPWEGMVKEMWEANEAADKLRKTLDGLWEPGISGLEKLQQKLREQDKGGGFAVNPQKDLRARAAMFLAATDKFDQEQKRPENEGIASGSREAQRTMLDAMFARQPLTMEERLGRLVDEAKTHNKKLDEVIKALEDAPKIVEINV